MSASYQFVTLAAKVSYRKFALRVIGPLWGWLRTFSADGMNLGCLAASALPL
jgi:hypothetical protein